MPSPLRQHTWLPMSQDLVAVGTTDSEPRHRGPPVSDDGPGSEQGSTSGSPSKATSSSLEFSSPSGSQPWLSKRRGSLANAQDSLGRTLLSRELQRGAEGQATVAEQGLVLPVLLAPRQQPGLQPPRHPENSVQSAKLVSYFK